MRTAPDRQLAQVNWMAPRLMPGMPALGAATQCWVGLRTSAEQRTPGLSAFYPRAYCLQGRPTRLLSYATGQVPTREGLHDLFNGLIWHHFPHSKAVRITACTTAIGSAWRAVRGRLRDALTVFDENAALLQAPDALWRRCVRAGYGSSPLAALCGKRPFGRVWPRPAGKAGASTKDHYSPRVSSSR